MTRRCTISFILIFSFLFMFNDHETTSVFFTNQKEHPVLPDSFLNKGDPISVAISIDDEKETYDSNQHVMFKVSALGGSGYYESVEWNNYQGSPFVDSFGARRTYPEGTHTISAKVCDLYFTDECTTAHFEIQIENAAPRPAPIFISPVNITSFTEVIFSRGESTDPDGDPVSFDWKIGDGQWKRSAPNGYFSPGEHTVYLRSTDSNGNQTISEKTFHVRSNPPTRPVISLEPEGKMTSDQEITFSASSFDADGDKITFFWKINNEPWTIDRPKKTFAKGTYLVMVYAEDEHGKKSEISYRIFDVSGSPPSPPNISVTPKSIHFNTLVSFQASGSVDADGDPFHYEWRLGDGPWRKQPPNGKFKRGEHTIEVRAVDADGNRSEIAKTSFTVENLPPAAPEITPSITETVSSTEMLSFEAEKALDPEGDDVRYEWKVNDGVWISEAPNQTFKKGTNTVFARSVDAFGGVSKETEYSFQTKNSPPSDPEIQSSFTENGMLFEARATDPDQDDITFEWKTENGSWSSSPPNGPLPPGKHMIFARAKDADGAYSGISSIEAEVFDQRERFDLAGDWEKSNLQSKDGSFSWKSRSIEDGESSAALLTLTIPEGAEDALLSFDYLVRSEEMHDFFFFSVNGETLLGSSGFKLWSHFEHPLPPGTHVIEFRYQKNDSIARHEDAVFIDNLRLTYQMIREEGES